MSRLTWGGSDAFTHILIVGPTRCGKTATVIKPIIWQILTAKARGYQCGISVIEPKGDVAQFTIDLANELGFPSYHLDPTVSHSDKINLMKGPINDVAEATIAVLKGMFGKQEAFFQLVQELTARNFIKLLKVNHDDNLDFMSVLRALRDDSVLTKEIKLLESSGKDPELLNFFQNEMRGKSGDKWRDLALGLRAQVENIVSNEDLRAVITGDSGINLDQHMAEGGIIAINTALGKLRRSGDAFGQFMAMHLQSATFRRPGTEQTRIPHYLIIDEKSRYINPDTEKFLSIAAEYRTAAIFAVQSFSQLELESGDLSARAMKTAILSSCRNKICFGGVTFDDAEYFAKEIGKDWSVMRQSTYDGFIIADFFPKTYRDTEQEEYRIRPTDIQDGLPRFHYIYKLVQEGHPTRPGIAVGDFVPRDWREQARRIREQYQPQAVSTPLFSIPKITKEGGEIEPQQNFERGDVKDKPEQEKVVEQPEKQANHLNEHSSKTHQGKPQQAQKPINERSNHRIQRKKVYVNTAPKTPKKEPEKEVVQKEQPQKQEESFF